MDGSIFFVHGTGTWESRKQAQTPGAESGLETTLDIIRKHLADSPLAGVTIDGPAWGEDIGPGWPDIRLALPPEVITKAIGDEELDQVDDGLRWDLLLTDPLVELRLAGLAGPPEVLIVPGAELPEVALSALVRQIELPNAEAAAAGIDRTRLATATGRVADSAELASAARASGAAVDPELLDMAARAVVAAVLADYREDSEPTPPALLSGAVRAELLARVRLALAAGSYKGIVPKPVWRALGGLATRFGTRWAVPRRSALMDPVTSFVADIAFYLQRGEVVRRYLNTRLAVAPRPVVVLAHSLGGVAMVDLLSGENPPRVDLLVTAGSQAPFLYLIDSLESLRPGRSTKPFAQWLNIYNRKDLLSFCAERMFPGIAGIEDVEVDPGVPFPESHSAYWTAPEMWEAVARRWPR